MKLRGMYLAGVASIAIAGAVALVIRAQAAPPVNVIQPIQSEIKFPQMALTGKFVQSLDFDGSFYRFRGIEGEWAVLTRLVFVKHSSRPEDGQAVVIHWSRFSQYAWTVYEPADLGVK